MKRASALDITRCALFVALITIGSFIKVPIPLSPFTLQFLMTSLAGRLLGPRWGTCAVAAYVVAGLAGLPIFAEGGGIGYIANPNFGYLVGFVLGTWATAKITPPESRSSRKRLVFSCFVGLMVCYAVGMVYLYAVSNFVLGTTVTFAALIWFCFIVAIPGDLALCFAAAEIAYRVLPAMQGRKAPGKKAAVAGPGAASAVGLASRPVPETMPAETSAGKEAVL